MVGTRRSSDITEPQLLEALAELGDISDEDRNQAAVALTQKGFPGDANNSRLYVALRSRFLLLSVCQAT